MFYSLSAIPVPPALDFNHVKPSSQESFDGIMAAVNKRSEVTALINGVVKDGNLQNIEPDKVGQKLDCSFDLVR